MNRTIIASVATLFLGLFVGWQAKTFTIDARDGIQWKLNDAASRGDIREMKQLIAAGADPLRFPSHSDGSVTGATPIIVAASAGEPEAVEFLINLGSDVNLQEADVTPIDVAEHRLEQTESTIQIIKAHLKARSDGFTTKAITPSRGWQPPLATLLAMLSRNFNLHPAINAGSR